MKLSTNPFEAFLNTEAFTYLRKYLYWRYKATKELSQGEVVHQKAKELMVKHTDSFRKHSDYFDPGEQLTVRIGNHAIRSPITTAAGFDKDCEVLIPLSYGFRLLTPGSVVRHSRFGNEQPRLAVDNEREAIINAQGYPHKGLEYTVENLKKFHQSEHGNTKILLNFSGITDVYTEDAVLESCKEIIVGTLPYIDFGLEESRSSPNTDFNKKIQTPEFTKQVMDVLNTHAPGKIKSSKIAPYNNLEPTEEDRSDKLKLIKAFYENGGDIVVLNNTRPIDTKSNPLTKNFKRPVAGESGRPLFRYMLKLVEDVHRELPDLNIIACGGIFDGYDAWQAYQKGATLLGLYTALTFYGFGVVRKIQDSLKKKLGEETLQSYIERRDAGVR